ncbi:MAG TPA: aldo/keto reductase [Candidatus Xenobia bacterium]|nr:aldo/keto reductase [Candidatus Xenobia bacterium]
MGLGTYLGEHDAVTDQAYAQCTRHCLEMAVNVIDTAINYRFQRSERSIGKALGELIADGKLSREEAVIATKGGFLTFDAEVPADPNAYFRREYLDAGVVKPEEVVGGMHCLAPAFIANQLERSRRNLNLETIDIYFLHNPETQLQAVARPEFLERMRAAFERLEEAVKSGAVGCYGVATWDGFRRPPKALDYLSLEELVKLAEEVGGEEHHFKAVQLPFNLAMPEAYAFFNQTVAGEKVSLLEATRVLGITVLASASILQGQVARGLPDELRAHLNGGLKTDAQRALQFTRSAPGVDIALVGMKQLEHVEENLRLREVPLLAPERFRNLFDSA